MAVDSLNCVAASSVASQLYHSRSALALSTWSRARTRRRCTYSVWIAALLRTLIMGNSPEMIGWGKWWWGVGFLNSKLVCLWFFNTLACANTHTHSLSHPFGAQNNFVSFVFVLWHLTFIYFSFLSFPPKTIHYHHHHNSSYLFSHASYSFFRYLSKTVTSYLPTQVTDVFSQGRAFASVTLPEAGVRRMCAITTIQKQLRWVISPANSTLTHSKYMSPLQAIDCIPGWLLVCLFYTLCGGTRVSVD